MAKYIQDILDVGTKKAVGHLPLETIIEDSYHLEDVITSLKNNKIKYKVYKPGKMNCAYITAYDKKMLSTILEKYSEILEKAGVPTKARLYMSYLHSHTVCYLTYPQAYVVVGKTFNDRRFRKTNPFDVDECKKTILKFWGKNWKS